MWASVPLPTFSIPSFKESYAAIVTEFAVLSEHCNAVTPELMRVQDYGLKACALQNNSDVMTASMEFQKGLHFGPALSLMDSAVEITKDKDVNHCARAFREAERVCPTAFLGLLKEEGAALLEAAK